MTDKPTSNAAHKIFYVAAAILTSVGMDYVFWNEPNGMKIHERPPIIVEVIFCAMWPISVPLYAAYRAFDLDEMARKLKP